MSKARNLVTNTNKIIGISDKFDPTTGQLGESGDIIPEGSEQKDLGSANNKFRHLYLSSNSIFLGDKTVSADQILDFDLNIAPEVLEIQVAAPDAGQDTSWLWTWLTSSLPYARTTITNQPQGTVPLYKQGTYTINNFAKTQYGSMTQPHTLYFKWIEGAGTQNLISWATDQGTFTDSHPSINDGNDTTVQRYSISVPSTIAIPTLTAPSGINYNVTNNASGAYTFSDAAAGDNINIGPLYRGGTYTFTVNASGHPFYLTTDNGTNYSATTYFGEYLSGVTNSRTDSGSLTFVVPNDAPDTLYYQCGNHSAMRGAITIKDLAVETNNNGNYIVYAQHTQEGHKTPIELRPIPSLTSQMCIVYDASINKFVPQDLATYVENTPSFKNKIQEVAGTATLVAADGDAIVAKVEVYYNATYLPLLGNNTGDLAFANDVGQLYIWNGTAWVATSIPFDPNTLSKVATDYTVSTTAPTTPDNEDHWYDTATRSLKVRDTTSTSWIPVVASNNSTIDYTLTVEDGYNTALAGPLNIGINGSINIKGNLNII